MSDAIYLIDPKTKTPTRVCRVSFPQIGVKERQDLEAWIVAHPELLGERLLVITSEFHRFDKSNKRLDVLALDEDGTLVIVELKLDVAGSHADLQAIRYAAFCSTMTMKDMVAEYAANHAVATESAEQAILKFLGVDELPELGDRPRVILAAGSMDDQEVTSCVLWLRRFNVDISCVELTPYRFPDGGIVLVPKTIIPLPETRDYTVKVERKEATKAEATRTKVEHGVLWSAVKAKFNALDCPIKVGMNSQEGWLETRGGSHICHYAWWWMKRQKVIRVGIGFRSAEAAESDANMNRFRPRQKEMSDALGMPVDFQSDWGLNTRRLYVAVPFDESSSVEEVAAVVAEKMAKMIDLTLPTLTENSLRRS